MKTDRVKNHFEGPYVASYIFKSISRTKRDYQKDVLIFYINTLYYYREANKEFPHLVNIIQTTKLLNSKQIYPSQY